MSNTRGEESPALIEFKLYLESHKTNWFIDVTTAPGDQWDEMTVTQSNWLPKQVGKFSLLTTKRSKFTR